MLILVPQVSALAASVGLVDHPDPRKQHRGEVPLCGGIAMYLAFLLCLLILGTWRVFPKSFYIGASMMLAIGVLDDRYPLSAIARLLFQVLTIWAVVTLGGHAASDLGAVFGAQVGALGSWVNPITILAFVGLINAVNLSDGADGLAGGLAGVALVSVTVVLLLLRGDAGLLSLSVDPAEAVMALIGCVGGFLLFNIRSPWRRQASIFMGDGGSMFLGFVVGWLLLYCCIERPGIGRMSPVTSLWLVLVPLFDMTSCMYRRTLAGQSPMHADRLHVHHLLQAWGLSTSATVATLVAVNAAAAAFGIALWRWEVSEFVSFVTWLALLSIYTAMTMRSWKRLGSRAGRSRQTVRSR